MVHSTATAHPLHYILVHAYCARLIPDTHPSILHLIVCHLCSYIWSRNRKYFGRGMYRHKTHKSHKLHNLQTTNPIHALQRRLLLGNRDLLSADIPCVNAVYNYVRDIVLHKSIPLDFFQFERISDVMLRCHKFILLEDADYAFELRFNIFLQCAETFIHNHQSHFISLCLSGGFVHDHWAINETCNNRRHHRYQRVNADVVQYKGLQRGGIEHQQRSIHRKGCIYFLDRDALHTVCTPQSSLYRKLMRSVSSCCDLEANIKHQIMSQDAVTFVVRSKQRKPYKTTIVSGDFVDPQSTENAGGKTELSRTEKIETIKLLFRTMAN